MKRAPLVVSLIAFPLWGIILPLKIIASSMVYVDPPVPSFLALLRLFFSGTDLAIIGAGWFLFLCAAILVGKGDRCFLAIVYVAVAVFLGYSIFLFTNGPEVSFIVALSLGIYIVLTQGLVYALARMEFLREKKYAQ